MDMIKLHVWVGLSKQTKTLFLVGIKSNGMKVPALILIGRECQKISAANTKVDFSKW